MGIRLPLGLLSTPFSLARTVLRSEAGEVADSREFTVNLNTGAVIDW